MEIGVRIKKIRTSLGQTQGEFAKKLGLSRSAISKVENGSQEPSMDVLSKLFEMRTSFSWLFAGEGPMFRDPNSETVTSLPEEDSGFREALPDVYALYQEVQRLKTGQPGAASPIPEFEELDDNERDAVAEFARFRLARQRERESKSLPKPPPALPPAAASSKDEVHEPAPEYGSDEVELPLHYGLAAGEPMDTFFASDVYKVAKSHLKGSAKNYAAFVVAGTSMVNADINDGDTVIIRKDPDARDGRIHLFRHDGQFTLKRFRRGDKGSARLAYDDGSGRSVAVGPGEWKVIGAFAFVAERKRG